MDTISTETWKICLPSDWKDSSRPTEDASYFESADETKGVYLSTWNVCNDSDDTKSKTQSFLTTELKSLHEMDGYVWEIKNDWFYESDGFVIAGFDAYDCKSCYRICSKIIGGREWIVRSSFHDYDCSDFF